MIEFYLFIYAYAAIFGRIRDRISDRICSEMQFPDPSYQSGTETSDDMARSSRSDMDAARSFPFTFFSICTRARKFDFSNDE